MTEDRKLKQDQLEVVFENGVLVRDMTFDEVRANAKI
jgi:hypothetical protein